MDRKDALFHAKWQLGACGMTNGMLSRMSHYREIILEVMSCSDHPEYERLIDEVAREKIDVVATSILPPYLDAMQRRIDDVRELLATP